MNRLDERKYNREDFNNMPILLNNIGKFVTAEILEELLNHINKLNDYLIDEEQGRLLSSPLAIKEKVKVIIAGEEKEGYVSRIEYDEDNTFCFKIKAKARFGYGIDVIHCTEFDIGKWVFREEEKE